MSLIYTYPAGLDVCGCLSVNAVNDFLILIDTEQYLLPCNGYIKANPVALVGESLAL